VLTACGCIVGHNAAAARPYFAEAIGLTRATGDLWRTSQILGWQAYGALMAGDPVAIVAVAAEGRDFAEAIGDRFVSRQCRWCLGWAHLWQGELAEAAAQLDGVATEADAEHDLIWWALSLASKAFVLAYQGKTDAARAAVQAVIETAAGLSGIMQGHAYTGLALAALADGDLDGAAAAHELAWPLLSVQRDLQSAEIDNIAQTALARGDLGTARRWAEDGISAATGRPALAMAAHLTRARIALADGELEQAERDTRDALAHGVAVESRHGVSDILEFLAALAADTGGHREAARLFAAADAIRQRTGMVRYKVYDDDYASSVAALRDAMGEKDFDYAWAEGAALSTDEAIAYAQRGRGQRKRPATGWASLTPTERDVVRLVSEGLANRQIATHLFVSPRTVQTHLTHIYTKLGLTSRVQLVQEAARHT
jgi:DNA-binding CsgD family transcriptional regulator